MKLLKVLLISMLLVLGACGDSSDGEKKIDLGESSDVEKKVDRGESKIESLNSMTPRLNELLVSDLQAMTDKELQSGMIFCDEYIRVGNESLLIINDPEIIYYGSEYQLRDNISIAENFKSRLQAEIDDRSLRIDRAKQEQARYDAQKKVETDIYMLKLDKVASSLILSDEEESIESYGIESLFEQAEATAAIIRLEKLLKNEIVEKYSLEGEIEAYRAKLDSAYKRNREILTELAWRGEYVEPLSFDSKLGLTTESVEDDLVTLRDMAIGLIELLETFDYDSYIDREQFYSIYSEAIFAFVELKQYIEEIKEKVNAYNYTSYGSYSSYELVDLVETVQMKVESVMKSPPEIRTTVIENQF